MTTPAADEVISAAASDAIAGIGLAVVTVGIVFVALVGIGFVLLVRRGRRAPATQAGDDSARRADIALVRLDDDIAATADELGFAVAQFGRSRTGALESAIESARGNLASAFAVKQRLDDPTGAPGSRQRGADRRHGPTRTRRREAHAQILMLCETAGERLETERTVFDSMRVLERNAARDIDAVRQSVAESRERMPRARASLRALTDEYSAEALAPVAANPAEAERMLDRAGRAADDAADLVDGSGVSSAAASVRTADRDARGAARLLDRVDEHGAALAASSARLLSIVDNARTMAAEAKRVRDSPPDPRIGAAVGDVIAEVERAVATSTAPSGRADPDAAVSRISAATDALDAALAGARNEEQRLAHARAALDGALLTARSQIATTHAYIGGRRSGTGAGARTRLAEAERLLLIAEAEADPVLALDTARASATCSRDADALARYDLLH